MLDGDVRAVWTDASSGDLRPESEPRADALVAALAARSPGATREVHFAHQVHRNRVAIVRSEGEHVRPSERGASCEGPADALVSSSSAIALAVLTADCAPIALSSPEGVFAAVHAGWRGVLSGVVVAAVTAMRDEGASEVVAMRGPCIRDCCYEFSSDDLDTVAERWGDSVRARSADGGPALDLPAAVSAALAETGVRELPGVDVCTACGGGYFSHRARRDTGRQALLVWRAGPADPA